MDSQTRFIPCYGNVGIDVSVTPETRSAHAAGTALRCTLGASLFGVGLTPISAVGHEPIYDETFDKLQRRGADLSALEQHEHSVTFTTTYDADGTITNFHIEHEEMINRAAEVIVRQALSDVTLAVLCPLPIDVLHTLTDRAHDAGAKTFAIIHYAQFMHTPPPEFLPLIDKLDYLVLNADEAQRITQLEDVDEAGIELSKRCRGAVFLTLAERGAAVFQHGVCTTRLPTLAQKVQNLLGAGDTFSGGVVAGLTLTGKPEVALTYGMLAASLVVARPNHELLLAAMG